MTRTLYIIDGSAPARTAWMACVAAGVDVDIHRMDTLEKANQWEEWFLQLNPKHCVPTLDDNGFTLWECRAIMRYVVDALSSNETLYPKDYKERALVDRHLDYDLACLYKLVGNVTYPEVFLYAPAQDQKAIKSEMEYLDTKTPLADGKYITGDHMTIADISSIATLSFLETIDFDFSPYPNVAAWIRKMKAKDFYRECNVGFESFKEEVKTLEWKVKNEQRMIRNNKNVYKSVIDQ